MDCPVDSKAHRSAEELARSRWSGQARGRRCTASRRNSGFDTTLTDPGILTITFNRPEVLNCVNGPMLREISTALRDAGDDDSVAVLVLTGAGERAMVPARQPGRRRADPHVSGLPRSVRL